jgi:hypothetical protein
MYRNHFKPPKTMEPPKTTPPPPPPSPHIGDERDLYLQWKSDAWRNVAVELYTAIKSKNDYETKKAMKHFKTVKKIFPFREE